MAARPNTDKTPAEHPVNGEGSPLASGSVTTAFSLGWNICVLYLTDDVADTRPPNPLPNRLPSPQRFTGQQRSLIWMKQVQGAVVHLDSQFDASLEDLDEVKALGISASTQIEAGDTHDAIRGVLSSAHMRLSQALSANDAQLAKAYHLGVSLAATCHIPEDDATLRQEFDRERIAQIGEWLADLSTLFPDHSSRAVRLSCSAWQRWAGDQLVNPVEAELARSDSNERPNRLKNSARALTASEQPLNWDTEGKAARQALVRQGELWQALLSGEKRGTEMLELPAYPAAAVRALSRGVRMLRGMVIPLVLVAAVVAFGIWLLTREQTGTDLAGLATLVGAIGFTWKGILGGLGAAISKVQEPIWGAALDQEIARAITHLPPGAKTETADVGPEEAAPAAGPQPNLLPLQEEIDDDPEGNTV